MNENYKFITVEELAHAIANAPMNTEFNFTFDNAESVAVEGEPTGWYGVKVTKIFDEECGVLCFGYYGGGCTQCADMYMISEDVYDVPTNANAIRGKLLAWFDMSMDKFEYEIGICVEVTDYNAEYLNYFESVEVCPHCMSQNVYPMWNTEESGFVAICKHCGEEILLCDECQHTILQDGEVHDCDWCETECGGKCHRGETVNNTRS
jgi:hypothetical protein